MQDLSVDDDQEHVIILIVLMMAFQPIITFDSAEHGCGPARAL